jgi:hypothetical protein
MIKKTILGTAIMLITSMNIIAQNEKIQSVFIYNFITKYIEWPDAYRSGDFVIGVLGNSAIINELNDIARKRTVGSQKIVIKSFKTAAEITMCHVLYVSDSKFGEMEEAVGKVGNTLVITNNAPSGTKGDAINFVVVDGKQRFGLKAYNAISKGLVVSPELGKLLAGNS